MNQYQGKEWLKRSLNGKAVSPLGEEVADLMGALERGLYHLSPAQVSKTDWSNPYQITISFPRGTQMATHDFDYLTRLVVLCHDRMIRCAVEGHGAGGFKLSFHKRTCREGDITQRHPTIEQAIEKVRAEHGPAIDAKVEAVVS